MIARQMWRGKEDPDRHPLRQEQEMSGRSLQSERIPDIRKTASKTPSADSVKGSPRAVI
jgi:hypothetical protein